MFFFFKLTNKFLIFTQGFFCGGSCLFSISKKQKKFRLSTTRSRNFRLETLPVTGLNSQQLMEPSTPIHDFQSLLQAKFYLPMLQSQVGSTKVSRPFMVGKYCPSKAKRCSAAFVRLCQAKKTYPSCCLDGMC